MKRHLSLALILTLLISLVCSFSAGAQTNSVPKKPTPGVAIAEAISTITGVAISPLLGVGAVGAWKYCAATTQQERDRLPWFAQPWFWTPALAVVFLIALKDVFGIGFPPLIKKPIDAVEAVAHKVAGLVAAGTFVPLIASVFTSLGAKPPDSFDAAGLAASHGFLAVIHPAWFYNALTIAALTVVFLVVLLASNAINILILLSPFPLIDALLKAFRFSIVALVALTALANPWLGALFSLVIIVIAYFIAGWSLRLTHFGIVFLWEFFTLARHRFTPSANANSMFLSRKNRGVPIRTYGELVRESTGDFVFRYRPWLILPERRLVLDAGGYAVGRGLVSSEIVRIEGDSMRSVLLLPPRYRSHETELSAVYVFGGVREIGLRKMFAWIRDGLGFKPRTPAAATA